MQRPGRWMGALQLPREAPFMPLSLARRSGTLSHRPPLPGLSVLQMHSTVSHLPIMELHIAPGGVLVCSLRSQFVFPSSVSSKFHI